MACRSWDLNLNSHAYHLKGAGTGDLSPFAETLGTQVRMREVVVSPDDGWTPI